jgi:hypothetical protein
MQERKNQKRKNPSSFLLLFLLLSLSLFACKNKAKEYRLLGIEALERGDGKAALENFNLALEKSNGQVSALQMDILAYKIEAEILLGNISDAEASLENYKALAKKDLPLLEERIAGKKLIQELSLALNEDKLEEAKTLLSEIKEKGLEEDREYLFAEAVYLEKTAKWQEAYEAFKQYCARYPGDEDAKRELGFLKNRMEALEKNPLLKEKAGITESPEEKE